MMIDWTLLNLPDPQFMANIGEPPPAIAPMPDGSVRPYYGQFVSYKYLRDRIYDYNKSSDQTNQNLNSLWPLFHAEARKFKMMRPKSCLNKPKNCSRKLTSERQLPNTGCLHNEMRMDNSEQPSYGTWPTCPKPANHAVWLTNYSKHNDSGTQNSAHPYYDCLINSKQINNDTWSTDNSKQPSNATWSKAENFTAPNDEVSTDSKQKNNETQSMNNAKRPSNATWSKAETAENFTLPNDEWSTDSKQSSNSTWSKTETAEIFAVPNDEWSKQKNNETLPTDNPKRPSNATWSNAETAQNSVRTNEVFSSNSNDTKDVNKEQKSNGYWLLDDSVDDVIMNDGPPQNHVLPAAYAMWRDLAKFMSERAFHWKEAEFEFRKERAAIMYEIQLERMRSCLLEVALEEFHRQEELMEMQRIIRKHAEPTL